MDGSIFTMHQALMLMFLVGLVGNQLVLLVDMYPFFCAKKRSAWLGVGGVEGSGGIVL